MSDLIFSLPTWVVAAAVWACPSLVIAGVALGIYGRERRRAARAAEREPVAQYTMRLSDWRRP